MIKRRVLFIIILLFLFIGSFVFYTNKAFLYSPSPTHYNLTQQMIDLYNLSSDTDITMKQAELILKGSIDEDTLPRQAFHLYDPIYNRAPFGVYTGKKWAMSSNAQTPFYLRIAAIKKLFTGTFFYHGDYSWQANVSSYAKNNLDNAYYGLGHTLHLIEDMTVPAHSRNDHHILGDPYEEWATANLGPDDYEIAKKLYAQGYFPKYLYSIEQAFDDLARYSNKYFFSKDTILSDDYNWPKIVKEKSEDYGFVSQRTYAWGMDENGKLFRLSEVKRNIIKNQKQYLIRNENHKLNHGYWERLAPRAVVYGAGVIKLFMKDIEWEKQRLANTEPELNWFQKAQLFVKGLLGTAENQIQTALQEQIIPSQPLPQPKPSQLPRAKSIEPLKENIEEKEQTKREISQPSVDEINPPTEDEISPDLDRDEIEEQALEQEQEEDKGTGAGEIVKGPKTGGTGGTGGISWKAAQEANQPQQQEEQQGGGGGQQGSDSLVINEIQIKNDEFVELYNPTNSAINLASYSFTYYSSARDWDNPYRNKEFPDTASISANGYYLIGLAGYASISGNPDADWQPYSSNQLSNSAGSVAIFPWDPSQKTASEAHDGVIDTAAWGDVENVLEGTSFQTSLGQDKSMQRKGTGQDTDDNNTDFEYKTIPSPKNSNNETRTPGTNIDDDTVISTNTTWTIAGSPYYIELNSNQWPIVEQGATLTIEPGVVVMPRGGNYTFLEIRGTLIAEGTASDRIVFTSIKDADYGGAGGAAAGDWVRMVFTSTSTNSSIKNAIFRYGSEKTGLQNLDSEMVKVDSSSIIMENATMEHGQSRGLHLIDSNSTITSSSFETSELGVLIEGSLDTSTIDNCTFENNTEYGLEIKDSASPTIKNSSFISNGQAGTQGAVMLYSGYPIFENNQTSDNVLNAVIIDSEISINQDETWEADMVYILVSNSNEYPTVASGSVLTLEPGAVLKPYGGSHTALLVRGELKAEATSGSEVIITSKKDDVHGGDTNNDGNATSPASGDWKNIVFESGSIGTFDHVWLYYSTTPAIVVNAGASVDIKDTVDYTP